MDWHTFRLADGRDFLLGQAEGGAQSASTQSLVAVAFKPDGQIAVQVLLAAASDFCPGADGGPPAPPVRSRILRWHVVGQVGGVPAGLTATVTWGQAPQADEAAACSSWRMPEFPVKTYRLRFRFDGRTFRPSGATRRLLREKFAPDLSLCSDPLLVTRR